MDWLKWRSEFPSCAQRVHMNHAGISPLPQRVAAALQEFAAEALVIDDRIYHRWEVRAEAVRGAFARLIGAEPGEVAFVRNTSEGLSLVAAGLDWQAGDNVVALADEYPSNVYPWWGLRRWGVETRMVPRPQARFGVDDVAPLMDGRTRLLAVSAVDWQTGFRADLPALGALCRERGVLFCVDAIQALGAVCIDVTACGIDALAVGGHKWLLAPEGCGALFVSRRIIERLHPVLLGWKSVREASRYLPYHFDLRGDATRLEPGSPPHAAILAFGAALDLLLEIGTEAIEARVLEITDALADGLRRRGASVVSPWGDGERSGIINFRLGNPRALLAALSRAGVVARERRGGIRLSPHFYASTDDVERVLAAVDDYLRAA